MATVTFARRSAAPPALHWAVVALFAVAALYGQTLTLERMVLDRLRNPQLSLDARETLLRQAVAYAPRSAPSRYQLAEVLARRDMKRSDEARELADRAVALNPRFAAAWALRGGLERNKQQAAAYIERAIELDPLNSPAYYFARAQVAVDDAERREWLLRGVERVPAHHPITPDHPRGPDWHKLNPMWAQWWQGLANLEPDPQQKSLYEERARAFREYGRE